MIEPLESSGKVSGNSAYFTCPVVSEAENSRHLNIVCECGTRFSLRKTTSDIDDNRLEDILSLADPRTLSEIKQLSNQGTITLKNIATYNNTTLLEYIESMMDICF